jgi:rhamnose transport system permease protein
MKVALFVLSGMVAALAGIILTSRLSTARANSGEGLTLVVITAVLLGGVNIFGGSGTIPGVVLAVFALAILENALRLASVSAETSSIAIGSLLIISVVIPTIAHQIKSAIDRTRGGRHPPPRSVVTDGSRGA